MKEKYYFRYSQFHEDEICYPESYFINEMKSEGLESMEVVEAIPDYDSGMAWCKHKAFIIEYSEDTCGKQCNVYSPRNGKSGCCKHYTTKLYSHGEKVTITQKRG